MGDVDVMVSMLIGGSGRSLSGSARTSAEPERASKSDQVQAGAPAFEPRPAFPFSESHGAVSDIRLSPRLFEHRLTATTPGESALSADPEVTSRACESAARLQSEDATAGEPF
jgi:hypothetical protein